MAPFKLYIVTDAKLSPGLKVAQACHAMRGFAEAFPVLDAYWYQESNNIVCLQHDNLPALVGTLVEKGFRVSAFREPDLRGSLTAIAVEPAAWKHLSGLRLVK